MLIHNVCWVPPCFHLHDELALGCALCSLLFCEHFAAGVTSMDECNHRLHLACNGLHHINVLLGCQILSMCEAADFKFYVWNLDCYPHIAGMSVVVIETLSWICQHSRALLRATEIFSPVCRLSNTLVWRTHGPSWRTPCRSNGLWWSCITWQSSSWHPAVLSQGNMWDSLHFLHEIGHLQVVPWWYTVYPKKYAHGFVVLCFVVVMQSFIMNSHEVFIHIHPGCFAGTGAIVRLPQCQWSKPDGYGKISQCITTTKHSKAKTVCIFLGIYCNVLTEGIIFMDHHTFITGMDRLSEVLIFYCWEWPHVLHHVSGDFPCNMMLFCGIQFPKSRNTDDSGSRRRCWFLLGLRRHPH